MSASADASEEAKQIQLLKGEEILYDQHPAWSRYFGWIVISLLLSVTIIGAFIGVPLLIFIWLKRKNTKYIVTNQRIIEASGIFGTTSTSEYRISDIRQIQTGASWAEKILGHGNLQFSTGAASMLTFNGIPNHQQVANSIREIQQEIE